MAKLERDRDKDGVIITIVTMSTDEHELLIQYAKPAIDKGIKKLEKRLEKLEGKKDAGYATDKDNDKIISLRDRMDDLGYIISNLY